MKDRIEDAIDAKLAGRDGSQALNAPGFAAALAALLNAQSHANE